MKVMVYDSTDPANTNLMKTLLSSVVDWSVAVIIIVVVNVVVVVVNVEVTVAVVVIDVDDTFHQQKLLSGLWKQET